MQFTFEGLNLYNRIMNPIEREYIMQKIATFHTTSGAMGFEKQLKMAGESCELRPVPRKISASCGICVAFVTENYQAEAIVHLDKIYLVREDVLELLYSGKG